MTTPTLDPHVLNELREEMGGPEYFRELVEIFLREAPDLVANMQQAVARSDAAAMERAAHTLKSNSATFGAQDLARLCGDVEDIGRHGTIDGAPKKVEDISSLFEGVRAALEAERGN